MGHILLLSILLSLIINALMFVIAYQLQTDKLTDISYAITFIALDILALIHSSGDTAYRLVGFGLVVVWASRIGLFLLRRVIKNGKDKRFDGMRSNFTKFARFWLGQAITVWLIMLALSLGLKPHSRWHTLATAGIVIWLVGLAVESIADYQKNRFKSQPSSKGKWIDEGLWSYSRHPNYFGEILMWVGIYIYVFMDLSSLDKLIALISPIFITFLLVFVSGAPILEKQANEKWGNQLAYKQYKARTRLIVLWPFKKAKTT